MITGILPGGKGGVTHRKPPKPPKKPKKPKKPWAASKALVLECVRCAQRYNVGAFYQNNYQLETYVCSYCYREMQLAAHEVCCFGKPSYKLRAGQRRLYGFDPNAEECAFICPDRELCRLLSSDPQADIV
jgi:hypothetical protein